MYQVHGWDGCFENAKSRTYDECSFVCMPNKQHGLGFKRIWAQPDGAAVFGCWCALIQTLSRQKKPRLGYLTDTGRPTGEPFSAEDLAFMWGCPVDLVQRMLDVCSGPKVGWLKALPDQIPDGYHGIGNEYCNTLNEEKEEKGREESPTTPKRDARAETRNLLLSQGLPSMDSSITEWGKLAQGRGRCRELDTVLEFIAWCIDRGLKDGKAVQYARDCAVYADEWASRSTA